MQATAAGVAVGLSGVIRDLVSGAAGTRSVLAGISGAASGYEVVYLIEVALMFSTIAAMVPLIRSSAPRAAAGPFEHGPLEARVS